MNQRRHILKGGAIAFICAIAVVSFGLTTLAYAGNSANSPYAYNVTANGGTVFTNDHRAKTTDSSIGVTPSTTGYYVSPNAYIPQSGTAIHCGNRTYVNWTGTEKSIVNYINERGYSYAKLAFDSGGSKSVTCRGIWRPDTR